MTVPRMGWAENKMNSLFGSKLWFTLWPRVALYLVEKGGFPNTKRQKNCHTIIVSIVVTHMETLLPMSVGMSMHRFSSSPGRSRAMLYMFLVVMMLLRTLLIILVP